ncbi:MAG: hypothetical protein AAGU75_14655 [Bacillota bacterium]
MLSCKYCDYYEELKTKSEGGKDKVSVCQFTDFIFTKDVEAMDIEYPCKNMSFQDYLDSIQEIKEKATA